MSLFKPPESLYEPLHMKRQLQTGWVASRVLGCCYVCDADTKVQATASKATGLQSFRNRSTPRAARLEGTTMAVSGSLPPTD